MLYEKILLLLQLLRRIRKAAENVLIADVNLHVVVKLLHLGQTALCTIVADVGFSQEELSCQVVEIGIFGVVHRQTSHTTQHCVLGDFYAKRTDSAQKNAAGTLFSHGIDAHSADVPGPSVLDLLVVDVQFFTKEHLLLLLRSALYVNIINNYIVVGHVDNFFLLLFSYLL